MCDGVTVPCVSFLAPGWFLFLLPTLFQPWIYELPPSPVQLMTRPARINEVPVWAKTQEATDCKVSETKMVPLQQPLAAQLWGEGLLCTAGPTESPQSGKEAIWDEGMDTHHRYQPHRALAPGYIPTCSSVAMTSIMWLKSVFIKKKSLWPSPWSHTEQSISWLQFCSITAISQVSRCPKVNLLDWHLCNQDCEN